MADAHVDVADDVLWGGAHLRVVRSTSQCGPSGWGAPVEGSSYGVALPAAGAFRRRADGVEQFVDVNTGFFRRRGEVSEVAHFCGDPHTGTIIEVGGDAVVDVFAALDEAQGPVDVTPRVATVHRELLAALSAPSVDDLVVDELILALLASVLEQRRPSVTAVRAAPSAARRRLVDDVCELLHGIPPARLDEIAAAVHYSPFHLCRVFREVTGTSMSRYRGWLRVQAALARLADGADDLSALAMDLGFSDHAHLTRSVVDHLGSTPSALRRRFDELRAS